MVPALQFENWQWLSLQLATPVVLWGAWPFHTAAWANLKHATATMDTLISVGVLAAWLWSVYALFLGKAGMPGMRMPFELIPARGAGTEHVYLEVAAVVTTLILLGRFFEARAKRRAGAALKALLELGAKDVAVLDEDGGESRIPVEQLRVGQRFVVRPGEKVATDGVVEQGSSAVDMSVLTGESVPVEVSPGSQVAGATVNAGGRLVVRATQVGSDTVLAQIAQLVRRRADRQGSCAAARRPGVRRLRARRHRTGRGHARLLAGFRRIRELRVHGRRRGAHHRLPVRARARHADRADGRYRPRRAARPAHQGTRGAGVHAPRRHGRAR
jgi:Cu+-exporting ATPase